MSRQAADGIRDTGTVLDRIVADRRERLVADRRATPESALAERHAALPGVAVDFAGRLRAGREAAPGGARVRLIAEVKRAPPSRGVFDADLDAASRATEYAAAGSAAVSVLTEPTFFRGSIADLRAVRCAFGADPDRPAILRKEFVFDRYQVIEAQAHGADALLLIVMMLTETALADLVANHGVKVSELPDDVIAALRVKTKQVLDGMAASDPVTRKVHDSFMAFKKMHDKWANSSERQFAVRVRGG